MVEDEYSAGSISGSSRLIRNDLAALAALDGRHDEARQGWQAGDGCRPGLSSARLNDALLAAEVDRLTLGQRRSTRPVGAGPRPRCRCHPPGRTGLRHSPLRTAHSGRGWPSSAFCSTGPRPAAATCTPPGWPSSWLGPGTRFGTSSPGSRRLGHRPGRRPAARPSEVLEFDAADWNVAEIQARYRRAVDAFRPITWSSPTPGT